MFDAWCDVICGDAGGVLLIGDGQLTEGREFDNAGLVYGERERCQCILLICCGEPRANFASPNMTTLGLLLLRGKARGRNFSEPTPDVVSPRTTWPTSYGPHSLIPILLILGSI